MLPDVPLKQEVILYTPMTVLQRQLYRAILDGQLRPLLASSQTLTAASASSKSTSLQNTIMQLRKVVNHPYLITEPAGADGLGEDATDQRIVDAAYD